jgi:hypothetical protein
MANNGGGLFKTIAIIGGTAVASVIAVRLFDKHLASRLGMGPETKALPPSDDDGGGEPSQQRAFQMPQAYNPYMNLTPLPPPQMIPVAVPFGMQMPQMPQLAAWPYGQQTTQTVHQSRLSVAPEKSSARDDEDEDEDDENVLAFMREVEGD